jgi:predicted Zn-dependent protease
VSRRRILHITALAFGVFAPAVLLVSQTFNPPAIPENVLKNEPILRAMRDEIARSQQLGAVGGADAPYFISYSIGDANNLSVSSTLGATVNVQRTRFRAPQVHVRVGSYDSDNTNHISSGAYNGSRYDGAFPLEDDYQTLRDSLWLVTDRVFKTALQSIARKRATANNAATPVDPLPDYSRGMPVVSLPEITRFQINDADWIARANRLSSVFAGYPEALSSAVELQVIDGVTYEMNTEGSALRYQDGLVWVWGKAEGQAPDGMVVHDAVSIQALEPSQFPPDEELRAAFLNVAENVRALANAPAAEAFAGPTLFEPRAAAQLLAQLLGDNLRVTRRPLTDPGRPVNVLPSEFETRLGARVLPDFLSVLDDPTRDAWNGKPLVGHYKFDMEGVPAQAVPVVEEGSLKSFLTTRTPIKGFPASNGHARLLGSFGAYASAIANLFVTAEETKPLADLKAELIAMIGQRGLPYGMLVRKLDYPYSGTTGELQALAQANSQAGGGARPVSPPLLVYRIYADGREELVRGLRFRGMTARTLRDVLAASSETAVFDFVNTASPLAMLGSGGYLAATSVVSPALLLDEVEFDVPQEQLPKPPTVPPPPDIAP